MRATTTGRKTIPLAGSLGKPKRERNNASAVTFRTNANIAAYGRVLEKIPRMSSRTKSAAARGRPQTTSKRKSNMIWSGLRVANVCLITRLATPTIRFGSENNKKRTYDNAFIPSRSLQFVDYFRQSRSKGEVSNGKLSSISVHFVLRPVFGSRLTQTPEGDVGRSLAHYQAGFK